MIEKITEFNQFNRQIVSHRAIAALKVLADELGLEVKAAGGTYDHDGMVYTPKFQFAVKRGDGKPFDRKADDFHHYCGMFGLKRSDLGRSFVFGGTTYKLVGLIPGAKKYLVIGERSYDKKCFKFDAAVLKDLIPEGDPFNV